MHNNSKSDGQSCLQTRPCAYLSPPLPQEAWAARSATQIVKSLGSPNQSVIILTTRQTETNVYVCVCVFRLIILMQLSAPLKKKPQEMEQLAGWRDL